MEGYSGEGVGCGGYSGYVEGEGDRATVERVLTVEGTQGMRRVRGWRATVERVLTVEVTQGMWRVRGIGLRWRGC